MDYIQWYSICNENGLIISIYLNTNASDEINNEQVFDKEGVGVSKEGLQDIWSRWLRVYLHQSTHSSKQEFDQILKILGQTLQEE